MGKSTVSGMFREEGVPVVDADAIVHELYQPGGAAVAPVLQQFPSAQSEGGGISRQLLSKEVVGNEVPAVPETPEFALKRSLRCAAVQSSEKPDEVLDHLTQRRLTASDAVGQAAIKQLESIVHPLVVAEREKLLAALPDESIRLIVFDIPLLFETNGRDQVSAPCLHLNYMQRILRQQPRLRATCMLPSKWVC
jgi:dephospho-CoA kinase